MRCSSLLLYFQGDWIAGPSLFQLVPCRAACNVPNAPHMYNFAWMQVACQHAKQQQLGEDSQMGLCNLIILQRPKPTTSGDDAHAAVPSLSSLEMRILQANWTQLESSSLGIGKASAT